MTTLRTWITAIAISAALIGLSVAVRASPASAPVPTHRQAGSLDAARWTGAVLVDLADDATAAEQRAVGALVRRAVAPFRWGTGQKALGRELSDAANLFRVVPPASERADILAALRGHPHVEAVELEGRWAIPQAEGAHRLHLRSAASGPGAAGPRDDRGRAADSEGFIPNDPYYRHQWHLEQIQMPHAWRRARGEGITVAVIDTGVAYRDGDGFRRAPDLAQTRIVEGYDFVRNDPRADDEHGHGTHVAGTVAQSTHNGVGVAGVAPRAAIMPIKVLDRNGSGGWGAIAAGIRFAADHGAKVINMSLGGGFPSRVVQNAIDHAHRAGVVVVAAAGNASRSRVEYPARHNHVISVGAVRFDRTLSFYSNYGEGLDLVAPGGDMRVDQNGDGLPDGVVQNTLVGRERAAFDYVAYQGTSMAAPHVAGVAALVVEQGVTDPDAVERILLESADSLRDQKRYGAGLLQAAAALAHASSAPASSRALLSLLLGGLLFVGLGRRRGTEVSGFQATGMGLGVVAFGWALSWSGWWTGIGSLAPAWALPLVLNAAPFVLLVLLTYHAARMRFVLVGLGLALAATLWSEAFWPTLRVAGGGVWFGPWLALNGLVALALSWLVAARSRVHR